jgi:hemerythrin-like domain-containing protein
MFRRLDEILRTGSEAALAEALGAAELKPWLARHLQTFLWQLEEHHQVEDVHYFPVFRRVEPRLAAGFELLERDHGALHTALGGLVEVANRVLAHDGVEPSQFGAELARFRDAQAELGRALARHLDDEEDLVVPLLLERGEAVLHDGAG